MILTPNFGLYNSLDHLYSNNDTVTTVRPAVLNDAYYLEDEDVSDEEDVPVENRDGSVDLNVWTYDSSCLYLSH